MTQNTCFICERAIPAESIIYEDNTRLAFLDKYPPTQGYTLVAVKNHVTDITHLSKAEYLSLQELVHQIARSIQTALKPEKICILQTGGFVPHLHFHVIPIYESLTKEFLETIMFKHSESLPRSEQRRLSHSIKRCLDKL